MQYKTCPFCGDNLDVGEVCTCQPKRKMAKPKKKSNNNVKLQEGGTLNVRENLCVSAVS